MKELLRKYKKPFFIGLPILLLLTLLLKQCWVNKSLDPYINPPSADYDIPFEQFLINADSLTNIYKIGRAHV